MTGRPTVRALFIGAAVIVMACQPAPAARTLPPSTVPPSGAPPGLASGRVLYSSAGVDLWLADPNGGARVRLTTDGGAGGYLSAKPAPDGDAIAAERSMPNENGTALFVLRPGRPTVRLTKPDTFLDGYAWSPDGQLLTYGEVLSGATAAAGGLTAIGATGNVHLYVVQSGVDMVVGPGTHPAFSADGSQLGYAHITGAIALVDLRGLDAAAPQFPTRTLVALADLTRYSSAIAPRGMGLIGGPQFSADGRFVAYAAIESGPVLEAEQIVYVQEPTPGAPPRLFVLGKTGAIHHVADLRWSPTAPLLAYTIINAQPHHHWLELIDARSNERRELYDSPQHFLDYTWAPDGAAILVQSDESDAWLYFRPDRPGPVGLVHPGGWHPEWCRCVPQA